MNRREFLSFTAALAVTPPVLAEGARPAPVKVGICDWNLGKACDPDMIARAAEVGLDGIQVSVGTNPESIPLREKSIRRLYRELGRKYDIAFHSVAAGGILNQIPLKSEPQSAVYVIDAIEAAADLGAGNILIAFFGNGDLRLRDSTGEFLKEGAAGFGSYQLDTPGVTRVIETLRQIVPRAVDANVVLGLENTLTAEQNLEILDAIGSRMVQVYYDVGNSTHFGYDVPAEIRRLGKDKICEIHLKDRGTPLLGSADGEVRFGEIAAAVNDIGYGRWFVLESSGRKGLFEQDTRANVSFARRTFG